MPTKRWLPMKYVLSDGISLGRLEDNGPDWQIFRASSGDRVLVASPSLAERWVESGILPASLLKDVEFGDDKFKYLVSGQERRLESVKRNVAPDTKPDALAFAHSMRETRELDAVSPLNDAIYVERYSRLLPTWSLSQAESDEDVLGHWLTGGVKVSGRSLRRLASLIAWFDSEDLREVVEASGVGASPGSVGSPQHQTSRLESRETRESLPRNREGVLVNDQIPKRRQPFHLAGRPKLEEFLNEYVIDIVENPERYKAFGIEFPTAIVLHGPPGCGKTFAVERLVEYLDWPMYAIGPDSVGSPYIHETSRKISEVFEKAISDAPALIVIDEMEAYLSSREQNEGSRQHAVEEVGEFLRRIPEANKRGVLVIGMTNQLGMIDPAILRRGRFDHVIEVGMPSSEEVIGLLEELLSTVPTAGDFDTAALGDRLAGRALSDVSFVVQEAARLAARAGKEAIDEAALIEAIGRLPAGEPKKRSIGFIQDD